MSDQESPRCTKCGMPMTNDGSRNFRCVTCDGPRPRYRPARIFSRMDKVRRERRPAPK